MWKNLLVDIKKELSKYGLALREPATSQEIQTLQQKLFLHYNSLDLPTEYKQFLMRVNGLDFNGLVIYGVDKNLLETKAEEEIHGFIETNELWHENEWQKQFVFFGDSDIALYCYDLNQKVYMELDKPSGTIINTFSDFESMLEDALKIRLE
ncbi:SMI1/KNR4 family protein [Bacillus lacus]|uniref:SMI1/KNR4 family protein n=1 Tax=Metabacillus lacus TaxID=1983721 RepID=A0A7X2J202_9BACI|nr:SMI1/KNR4 family protein [Metabacillus lacus]